MPRVPLAPTCASKAHDPPRENHQLLLQAKSHNPIDLAPIVFRKMAPMAIDTATTTNGSADKASKSQQPASIAADTRYHASSTQQAIDDESRYAAHNYHPLPVVFARASGTSVWDPEGKKYLDFLSAYSAVNQGHCHPELVKALTEQAQRLTLSSRAFYNDVFPRFAECVTRSFGFDMVLPMNTGAEAVETALKIARKWGYKEKGIPENEAMVFTVANNFHGRTVRQLLAKIVARSRTDPNPVCGHLHVDGSRISRPIWPVPAQRRLALPFNWQGDPVRQ